LFHFGSQLGPQASRFINVTTTWQGKFHSKQTHLRPRFDCWALPKLKAQALQLTCPAGLT